MGSDKALLTFDGVSLLERACHTLAPWVKATYLAVGSERRYEALGFECVLDSMEGQGPLAGLHAGLVRIETPWVLLLACDMPQVDAGALQLLLESVEPGDQVVQFGSLELPEPMCALYHRSLVKHVEQSLLRQERRMVDFLSAPEPLQVAVRWLPQPKETGGAPAQWSNLNRPDDWKRWQAEQELRP